MPLKLFKFQPGIVKDITPYSAGKNGPFWTDANNVRFVNGYPQKIGGWTEEGMYHESEGYGVEVTPYGVPRNLQYWTALTDGIGYLAIGTHNHLYLTYQLLLYDITPVRDTQAGLSNPFTTVDTSSVVTVADTAHGAADGDWVVFSGASATNGIPAETINDVYGYQITYVDANSYTVDFGVAATSSGSGGGTVTATYLIGDAAGLGVRTALPNSGWGVSTWGTATWGTPRTISVSSVENSQWSLVNWGEDLVALVRNAELYYWDLSSTPSARAVLLSSLAGASDVPTKSRFATVSFPDRHLVCGGCTPVGGGAQEPMLVRWSDQENLVDWTPTSTNTAGDQLLSIGTKIVAMEPTRDETFIATDEAIYGMNFVGPPFTFSFRLVGTNCGAVGRNVVANVDGSIYWMGRDTFFFYNGAMSEIPCAVKFYVFDRLNLTYADKFFVAHNKKFNEVTWFYVSNEQVTANPNDPEPDSYVTFNYELKVWSIGQMNRTCWNDSVGGRLFPFAFTYDGYQYNHEDGTNADGAALGAYIQSSPMEISQDGDFLMLVDKVIPDATMTGSMDLTITSEKYPNGTVTTKGPFSFNSDSNKISVRVKGRQMALKFENTGTDESWELGDFRANIRQDGLR